MMSNDVIISVYTVIALVISFSVYYWIGKILGGMKHGKVITACVMTAFWMWNAITNAGGVDELMFAAKYLPGFVIGLVLFALVPMQIIAQLGARRPLFIFGKKEKWLV